MSYTVLAVKWRPRRFEQLVGQSHVVQALVNSLSAERLHHAYLFSGTRGVGKTTVARILAKALNCESGVVAEPCGSCEACTAIDEGRFVDLIEVDAASRTRVDDTRELLDNVQYMPTRGRYKVYLIDEVHMLSGHSFNALLKTLEEPPEHVKFLFATTDPQKLPVTVLSRCLQFNLKKLTPAQIQAQLAEICAAEGVSAEAPALAALAKAADGSMRDALSLLDQAIAFGAGQVEAAQVTAMLGSIDRGHVLRLLEALAALDGATILTEVEQLDELAPDYGAALDELMSVLQRLAVIQLVDAAAVDEDNETVAALAAQLSPEDVQLYYQIALQGRRDLAVLRDQRMGFEMTLLRMLAFRPEQDGEPAAAEPGRAARPGPSPEASRSRSRPAAPSAPPPMPDPPPAAYEDAPEALDTELDWHALLKASQLKGPARRLADHCELRAVAGNRLELVLAEDKAQFNTEQLRQRMQSVLGEHLGRKIGIQITPGKPQAPTPAELRLASENQRMRAAREAIEQDPQIKAVQAAFDAVVEADSVQPNEE